MEARRSGSQAQPRIPHVYVILMMLVIVASILTYVVPAGKFKRTTNDAGEKVVQPGTFAHVQQNPAGALDFITAVPNGLIDGAEIIFGIFVIGGMFAVIEKSGLIELGTNRLAHAFARRGLWIIPSLMIPFALFTSFTGQIEMSLVYLPAITPVVLRLGFDKVTATAIVLVSTVVGFTLALTAPANLGTAQTVAQLKLYSGMGFRGILLAIMLGIGILYVARHARQVLANPGMRTKYGAENAADSVKDTSQDQGHPAPSRATMRQLLATLAVVVAFVFLLYGLVELGWFFRELSGLYIVTGIVVGLIVGLRPSQIAQSFNDGFRRVLLGAIVVGVARAIALVLQDGDIMDTIIHAAGQLTQAVPGSVTAVMMLVVQAGLNFLISGGSGQALVTMPIMSGLADLTDVSRQTGVIAFLMGDGFSNIFYPTSGYFMAVLAIAGLRWGKWVKFVWPLLIIWYGLGAAALIVAQIVNYS